MTAFRFGDQPVSDFEFDLGVDVDPSADVELVVTTQSIPAAFSGDLVVGSWDALTLPPPGLYQVRCELTMDGRREGRLVDWLVVTDPDDQWHNVETARFEWDGAPSADGTLYRLLTTAREQVEAYGRELRADELVPELWRQAQLAQARNMFNATITNGENTYDAGGGVFITVRPLDWAVKQLIRPRTGRKALG